MRLYVAKRVTDADGILEIKGVWDLVGKIALLLGLVVLPAAATAQPLAALLFLPILFWMFVVPPRRVVRLDRAARELQIKHTGLFREREDRTIAFEDVLHFGLVKAGERNGYTRWQMVVELRHERLALVSLWDEYEAGILRSAIAGLWPGKTGES